MNCKWCNNILNGANDYQLVGFCNASCRMHGGDSDKVDLVAEIDASPRVLIKHENPPVVIKEKKVKKQIVPDVIPSIEHFFSKSALKDK